MLGHDLRVVKNGLENERPLFLEYLRGLKASAHPIAIVTECAGEIYTQRGTALIGPARPSLHDAGWRKLTEGLEALAELAEKEGAALVYRPRMGTLIQDGPEIDRLMESTQKLGLLCDSGHLTFAGAEPAKIFAKHKERVGLVYLTDIRQSVLKEVYQDALSYPDAVERGIFALPGGGDIDFAPLFDALQDARVCIRKIAETSPR